MGLKVVQSLELKCMLLLQPHVQRGFALIATMLSLLVFSVGLSLAFLQFSTGMTTTVDTVGSGASTLALTEGCAEGVLNAFQADPLFDDPTFILPIGECTLDISQNGNQYTILVQATKNSTTRSIQLEFTRGDTALTLTSWLEE